MKHDDLKVIANRQRKNILTMIYKAKSCHPGGSLSAVEIKQGLIEYCAENKLVNISEIVAYAHTDDGKAYRKRIFSE